MRELSKKSLWTTAWMMGLAGMLIGLTGCPTEDDDDDDATPETTVADLDVDADQTGEIEGTEDEDALELDAPGVVILVDVDDDNEDAESDRESVSHSGETENDGGLALVTFEVPDDVTADDSLVLTIDGGVEGFRIYLDQEPLMGWGSDGPVPEKTLTGLDGGEIELEVEGVEFYKTATLHAEYRDAAGAVLSEDEVRLTTSPWLMQHHLDDAHELWITDDLNKNKAIRDQFKEVLGEENVHELGYWDLWVQDEIQYGYQITADGPMSVVLDTIRDGQGYGGLTPFANEHLLRPDWGVFTVGTPIGNGYDYGGNLECTPPLTANGVDYPYGRIYYGHKVGAGATGPDPDVRDFFDAQTVQSPFTVDTTWLAVGHVDEFVTLIPDPNSDRGFKLLWASHDEAVVQLEALDPQLSLPRYLFHGFATVGEILEDSIMDYSADIDATEVQPQIQIMIDELELEEEDIIAIPGIWEPVGPNYSLAMMTGMVNLMVFDDKLFIPDPHFRDQWTEEEDLNGNFILDKGEDTNKDGMLNSKVDPIQAYVETLLPAGLEFYWSDTWATYHVNMGEIHCGTEVRRTPTSTVDWWTVATP